MKIIHVNAGNVRETGFFCMMSRRKSEGYRRKLEWLSGRFQEGLTIKMLDLAQGGRGFIEYMPGESAWRPVRAVGYMFIHCLWVVGKSKRRGYARLLVEECLADARSRGLSGVAMTTSEGNWMVGRKVLEHLGFESADQAPPSFNLMVRRFGREPLPSFPTDWEARRKSFGSGLSVVRADQCPYLEDGARYALQAARERGIPGREVILTSARDVRERAPSPYGVFAILRDGALLSYHYQLSKDLVKLLD